MGVKRRTGTQSQRNMGCGVFVCVSILGIANVAF
jgi:hypothetical protein